MKVDPMAKLTCGHYQRVSVHAAREYGAVVCLVCRQVSRPATVLLKEWHVSCETCKWERWTGQIRKDATTAKHRHLKGGKYAHFVRMDYATVPGMEYTQNTSQGVPTTSLKENNHDDSHLF